MSPVRRMSVIDQTVVHLKEGLLAGRWRGTMPGLIPLAAELGVAKATVHAAIKRIEAEGLIVPGAPGMAKRIRIPDAPAKADTRSLRVAILRFRPPETRVRGENDFWVALHADLRSAGYDAFWVQAPLERDAGSTAKLVRLVGKTVADAWLVERGPMAAMEAMAGSGRMIMVLGALPGNDRIASVSVSAELALRETVRRMVALGHRRIVFITLRQVRQPVPVPLLVAFREELLAAGIMPGEYHTPDWEETPEGMVALLESLFRLTPPTALLCHPFSATLATLAFCARRGLRIPEDVSMMSYHDDEALPWQYPGMRLAHLHHGVLPFTAKILAWLKSVARGAPANKRTSFPYALEPGNTLGPAKAL